MKFTIFSVLTLLLLFSYLWVSAAAASGPQSPPGPPYPPGPPGPFPHGPVPPGPRGPRGVRPGLPPGLVPKGRPGSRGPGAGRTTVPPVPKEEVYAKVKNISDILQEALTEQKKAKASVKKAEDAVQTAQTALNVKTAEKQPQTAKEALQKAKEALTVVNKSVIDVNEAVKFITKKNMSAEGEVRFITGFRGPNAPPGPVMYVLKALNESIDALLRVKGNTTKAEEEAEKAVKSAEDAVAAMNTEKEQTVTKSSTKETVKEEKLPLSENQPHRSHQDQNQQGTTQGQEGVTTEGPKRVNTQGKKEVKDKATDSTRVKNSVDNEIITKGKGSDINDFNKINEIFKVNSDGSNISYWVSAPLLLFLLLHLILSYISIY